jgi:hypothetical protein
MNVRLTPRGAPGRTDVISGVKRVIFAPEAERLYLGCRPVTEDHPIEDRRIWNHVDTTTLAGFEVDDEGAVT